MYVLSCTTIKFLPGLLGVFYAYDFLKGNLRHVGIFNQLIDVVLDCVDGTPVWHRQNIGATFLVNIANAPAS